MNYLEKIKKLPLYVVVIAIALYVPWFIQDKGLAIFMFVFIASAVIFITSLVYGIKNRFCGLLALITALLTASIVFLFLNKTAWIYIPIYWVVSLVGTAIGTAFNKEYKSSQAVQWIVWIFWILLLTGWIIVMLNYTVFKEPKPVITKNISSKKENTQSQCQDFKFQQNYLCSYDAGIFSWDKDLSFANKKANEIRGKTKNNAFSKNWKSIPYNELSYPTEDNLNPDWKIAAQKGVYTIKVQYGEEISVYIVSRDWKELYRWETTFTTQEPYKNFVVDEKWDWWFLYSENLPLKKNNEVYNYTSKNILVHNGKVLDYEDVFELQEFDGKVFYFFEKSRTSKISYYLDGKVFETDFSEIIHDKCCEPAIFNIDIATDGRIKFWWIMGESFVYNEMYLLWENAGNKKDSKEEAHQKQTVLEGALEQLNKKYDKNTLKEITIIWNKNNEIYRVDWQQIEFKESEETFALDTINWKKSKENETTQEKFVIQGFEKENNVCLVQYNITEWTSKVWARADTKLFCWVFDKTKKEDKQARCKNMLADVFYTSKETKEYIALLEKQKQENKQSLIWLIDYIFEAENLELSDGFYYALKEIHRDSKEGKTRELTTRRYKFNPNSLEFLEYDISWDKYKKLTVDNKYLGYYKDTCVK